MARGKQLIARERAAVWIFSVRVRCLTTFDFASDGCAVQSRRRGLSLAPKNSGRRTATLPPYPSKAFLYFASTSLERLKLTRRSTAAGFIWRFRRDFGTRVWTIVSSRRSVSFFIISRDTRVCFFVPLVSERINVSEPSRGGEFYMCWCYNEIISYLHYITRIWRLYVLYLQNYRFNVLTL